MCTRTCTRPRAIVWVHIITLYAFQTVYNKGAYEINEADN